MDVSKCKEVFSAVEKTFKAFGDFTVIVNNAGIGPITPIDTITQEQFDEVFRINAGGVIWGIQAVHVNFFVYLDLV
ncbi:SDR family NAD(P)-dependent oxidoreductase [Enterococcus sp. DIV0869a]|uniref:SDR family NAD(P)-dependent oxidoreductase n=1 Tax=Candidatus Enterococcus ikei TaxID=2815326 RepID=A0ABS3GX81_9ENTE|nr:SDR family NAD(P)-dependent oxidoreductase [Enterococcus sp. DIV0869a]